MPEPVNPPSCVRRIPVIRLTVTVRLSIFPLSTVVDLSLDSDLSKALNQPRLEAALKLLHQRFWSAIKVALTHGNRELTLAIRLVVLVYSLKLPQEVALGVCAHHCGEAHPRVVDEDAVEH